MAEKHGWHHYHVRKRIHVKHEKYPSRDRTKRLFDRLIYVFIAFGIIMTIPQLWNVWLAREVAGVSAISWAGYAVTSLFWLGYGILHREKPIVLSSGAWFVLQTMIAAGVVLYG